MFSLGLSSRLWINASLEVLGRAILVMGAVVKWFECNEKCKDIIVFMVLLGAGNTG